MNGKNIFIGFSDKIKRYDELEILKEKLEISLMLKQKEHVQAVSVLNYLKKYAFPIDSKLLDHVEEKGIEYIQSQDLLKECDQEMDKLYDDLIPGNFRNVIYCMAREKNIDLEKLAEDLNCSSKNCLKINLCRNGYISKDDYLKICKYFGLNEKSRRYIRYCDEIKAEFDLEDDAAKEAHKIMLDKLRKIDSEINKLEEDKEKLIIQLVDMEELKDENKRLRESLDKIKSIK